MKILGLDPGKTTGVALLELNEKALSLVYVNETKDETLLEIVDYIKQADYVICEEFLVRPNKAHGGAFDWSDMVAPRVIGAATSLAKQYGAQFVLQSPSIKPVGYGWSAMQYVKGKQKMHMQDAVCHAVYFSVKKLHALPLSKK
jgi:hypothetical protein